MRIGSDGWEGRAAPSSNDGRPRFDARNRHSRMCRLKRAAHRAIDGGGGMAQGSLVKRGSGGMVIYRSFRNTDPPLLADLLRAHVGRIDLPSHVTVDLLEQLVFAKLYFDYDGLILACEGERLLGFVHAGFGADPAGNRLDHCVGVIAWLLMRPDAATPELAGELIQQAEAYLRRRGAQRLIAGSLRPNCPFYAGVLGLAEPPGVSQFDETFERALLSLGFHPQLRTITHQRTLPDFEAPIDRRQMEIRRRMIVEATFDVPTRTWWEACLWNEFELTRLELMPRGSRQPAASAVFRALEAAGSSAAYRGAGLIDITVDENYRRRGLAVYLLSEACRQFSRQGMTHLFALVRTGDLPAEGLLAKVGFKPVYRGTLYEK